MFLLLTLLFFTMGSTLPADFDYDEYLLANVIYALSELKLCPDLTLDQSMGKHWFDLPSEKQGELFYCLSKISWSESGNPNCEVMMKSEKLWSEMDLLEKRMVTDCGFRRFVVSAIGDDLHYLSDFFSNIFQKDKNSIERMEEIIIKCFLVRKQFQADLEHDYEGFSSNETRKFWSFLNLNTSHYNQESITDDESLEKFRRSTTIDNYMIWNNLTGCGGRPGKIEFLPVILTFLEAVRKEKPEWISEPVVDATKDQPWKYYE